MELYNEALRLCESHSGSLLALSKLHLSAGNMDACQQQCVVLLKHDPDNEEAAVMLAELMFHKVCWGRNDPAARLAILPSHQSFSHPPTPLLPPTLPPSGERDSTILCNRLDGSSCLHQNITTRVSSPSPPPPLSLPPSLRRTTTAPSSTSSSSWSAAPPTTSPSPTSSRCV